MPVTSRDEPTAAKSRPEFETVTKQRPASWLLPSSLWLFVVGATSSEICLVLSMVSISSMVSVVSVIRMR